MNLPSNYTEEQFIEIVNNIGKKLALKFRFAYHSSDDIKQQISLLAIEGLDKYDGVRPLENFLYIHVKNRLINFKRDNYQRREKPCVKCPNYDPQCRVSLSQCTIFDDVLDCELYQGWISRNAAKKNIISPIDIDVINDERENNTKCFKDVQTELNGQELLDIIDQDLPVALREDYLKMRSGAKLPKVRKERVQDAVLEILDRYN